MHIGADPSFGASPINATSILDDVDTAIHKQMAQASVQPILRVRDDNEAAQWRRAGDSSGDLDARRT